MAGAGYYLGTGCACAQNIIGCFPADPQGVLRQTTGGFMFSGPSDTIIKPDSGDKDLDYALAIALQNLRALFDVKPSFGFFDDQFYPEGNALATDRKLMSQTAGGTIIFGHKLLKELMKRSDPGAAVLAVCAHEFGHIVSYELKIFDQLVPDKSMPLRGEQYADYLAGFFAGTRKLIRRTFPAIDFLRTLGSMAGGHHGTKEQREQAVYKGFQNAYDDKMPISKGVFEGLEWAKTRPVA